MSTNFAKTLVWKQDYDVILWRHKQRTPNTNDYPMPLNEPPPMKSFYVRHWSQSLQNVEGWAELSNDGRQAIFQTKIICRLKLYTSYKWKLIVTTKPRTPLRWPSVCVTWRITVVLIEPGIRLRFSGTRDLRKYFWLPCNRFHSFSHENRLCAAKHTFHINSTGSG